MTKIYPDNFESKIGFDKIRELIKGSCLSSLGKDKVDEIRFVADREQIISNLSVTEELSRLLVITDNFRPQAFFVQNPN